MLILLTGGAGSGKSTAARYLAQLGFCVVDCDKIYHDMLVDDPEYIESIGKVFGFVKDGKIDREALTRYLFLNPDEVKKVEKLAHPVVVKRAVAMTGDSPVAFIEAQVPEAFGDLADMKWAVTADPGIRIERITQRDGCDRARAVGLLALQKNADYEKGAAEILRNDGTYGQLCERIDAALEKYSILPPAKK